MAGNKKLLYLSSFLLLVILALSLLIPNVVNRVVVAVALIPCAIVAALVIKRKGILSIHKKEVTIVMLLIAIIYLLLYYLSGLYFGFSKNLYRFSWNGFYKFIIPITIVIICTEIIRSVMISQKSKLVSVFIYLSFVIVEVLMSAKVQNIQNFDIFMSLMGITLFPALVSNLLFHYISKNYGKNPIIVYRLVTTLYLYIFSIVPNVPDYFDSFIGMLLPLVIFIFIKAMYEKKVYSSSYKKNRISKVVAVIALLIMAMWVMLVSCQFKYGLLVVGSESMTGEVNKGDAILYERYEDQEIVEGQVIVFVKNNTRIIHRVVEIKSIDGELRYITKGDANESNDAGYVTEDQIIGVTNFRILYIGYPTLWLRSIFGR